MADVDLRWPAVRPINEKHEVQPSCNQGREESSGAGGSPKVNGPEEWHVSLDEARRLEDFSSRS